MVGSDERPYAQGVRIQGVDLSRVHLHGASLSGARLTDAVLVDADISGDIEGMRVNGVQIAPLVEAELDRQFPDRVKLRANDVEGFLSAWSMLEELWAATTERALRLSDELQRQRVDGEWSFVETLRHLVCATDSWVSRAIRSEQRPYHPWGITWDGPEDHWKISLGLDVLADPGLAEVLPVRQQRQRTVRATLGGLSEGDLADMRTPPDEPGHPNGPHSVQHCLHVVMNEEWEHHRYATRDLAILEESAALGPGATGPDATGPGATGEG